MKYRRLALASLTSIGALTALSAIAPALAIEPTQIVPVFRTEFEPEDKFRHVAFANFPATGSEVLGLTSSCTVSAPDGNGMVKTTSKTRFFYRPATGGANVFTPSPLPTVVSLPYPDPQHPNNQCLGENQTEFDEGDFPNTENKGCPRDPEDAPYQGSSFDPNQGGDFCGGAATGGHFGVGIGTGGSSVQYVVFSDAITGTYRNATTGFSDVDFTNFAIHVYSMAGARVWTKSFPLLAGAGRLEPVLCGVGDFLNDDGEQELRLARVGETGTGAAFTYTYYDLDTGAQIGSQVTVNISNP